jgi:hypothetical protein
MKIDIQGWNAGQKGVGFVNYTWNFLFPSGRIKVNEL